MEVCVLTPDEIATIAPVFADFGAALPDPRTSFIMGALSDGKVVGFLVVQLSVHAEPMWIEPGHEAVFNSLVHATERTIAERAGECDVYLFAPAGKVARLAQLAGMRTEPWVVLSKHVSPEPPQILPLEHSNSESSEATQGATQ